ncbi:hypothetical protein F5Y08DRAFT_351763 [Xylaria arbuscula]|nr:hypothetical protein F5Y08DRAFT_351763 [Xylaria arbuscula]
MFPNLPNPIPYLKACCCFPQKRQRSNSPIRRAEYHNSRLRTNLGLELPARNPPGSRQRSQSIRSKQEAMSPRTPRKPVSMDNKFLLKGDMNLEQHKELSNLVHELLGHIPYAICGLSALVDNGYIARTREIMEIVCPSDSRKNVQSWAATKGYVSYGDSIAVPTKDGIRRVRVNYVEAGFEALQRVKSNLSNAIVLSLTSQLENRAAGYLQYRRQEYEVQIKVLESDIFWILKKMRSMPEKIDPRLLMVFLSEEFLEDFTKRNPHARAQIALAGINVSVAQAKIRANVALREHDQLLKKHGMQGDDVVTKQQPSSTTPSMAMPQPPKPTHARGRDLTAPKPPKKPKSKNRPPVEWV